MYNINKGREFGTFRRRKEIFPEHTVLSRGLSRVVIGSAAVKNPKLVREACKLYGEKIEVKLHNYLRQEKKFDTINQLISQLNFDKENVIKYFNSQKSV